ncbi:hypothetical protein GDO86_000642 [Hymenochirus boettgeri]|uniref:Protein transport protein Sec24B n=1 Tax=Hymenochirus boettgeri TaxID=247094 RepID=A0A8T2KAB6_9PIPI|nr:hypothetical protein GDO86_000642 [Hymenochirus boettgeri]
MAAPGPSAAARNGPATPKPLSEYMVNNASPAYYSQVPSKVIPLPANRQFGADYYSSTYATLSQNTLPQNQPNLINASNGSYQFYPGTSIGHNITVQSPDQRIGLPATEVSPGSVGPYPVTSGNYNYPPYSVDSLYTPQGLSGYSGQDPSFTPSHLFLGTQSTSLPASTQYVQAPSSHNVETHKNVQSLEGPSVLQHDIKNHTASGIPTEGHHNGQDSHISNNRSEQPFNSCSAQPVAGSRSPRTLPKPSLQEGIESSSTTSDSSSEPKIYDHIEGGCYTEPTSTASTQNTVSQTTKQAKPFGHGYPALQPGYQNAAPSHGSQSSSPVHRPNYQQYSAYCSGINQLPASLGGLSLQQTQEPEELRPVNLMQDRNILPIQTLPAPLPNLNLDLKKLNCNPNSFRCTLTNVPQTQALLNKAKLPLGLLLHPFRSKQRIPVISPSTIVRCRSCRTYINPFVSFIDQRRWKCNLCYRVNDVPEEFMYNPVTRSYGEPYKRPEVQNSSVEFIASSDYMLRPPPPAVYLFVLDVSYNAVESGYLRCFSESLLGNLDKLRGDSRTKIGFITFDSTLHFYNLQEGLSQPQMLIVSDIDDIFLPMPDGLLVNLQESRELVKDLLTSLPSMFVGTRETHSALGSALQGAFKLMSHTGGRMSVFQTQLPSLGAGLLHSREDPNQRSSTKGVQHLGPATDFYKKLALDCSGQQTAVDLFLLSSQYSDLASLACMSRYSAGSVYYYPTFHLTHNPAMAEKLKKDLDHYLTRKVGFEAVMRIRCTKGLSIHTFHGNLFVRSTDLLSLANINEDAGFAVQMSIDESLTDTSLVCFQVALLYTSSKGQRRIRVHTLCLPVVNSIPDVFAGADVQAITSLLANMAVDRSVSSSLSDARDALVNAVVDSLSSYSSTLSNLQQSSLIVPNSLKLFPLYILALLKQKAFRTGTSTRLDDRVFAMCQMKSQPVACLMKMIHPNLYRIDRLTEEGAMLVNDRVVPQPLLQSLSAEKLSREGAFLMDSGSSLYIWIGRNCPSSFLSDVIGYPNYASVPQKMNTLPDLNNTASERLRNFISWLKEDRSVNPVLYVIKDDCAAKTDFFQHLIEDRTEAAFSYYEFLLHIQQHICK